MNLAQDIDIQKELKENNLRYTSDSEPGLLRQGSKNNFKYYDPIGKRVEDEKTISRIESLGIPPAWKNVWISSKTNDYLQATGIDEKGRKQYIYHLDWTKISQENKFSKIIDFGLSLPKIRRKVNHDMKLSGISKQKLIATIVWLLENTFIRIGNDEYSKENQSFGLTTLRSRHTTIKGGEVLLEFKGKSGVAHRIEISNPTIVKTIKKCVELPGYELFKYIDDKGGKHVVDSEDINLFLKDITQDDFSAKDFRTWGASSLSAEKFYNLGFPEDKKLLKKNIKDTVKIVAKHLNNTPLVCRNYYIHPTVIQTYEKNILPVHFKKFDKTKPRVSGLSWDEYALIKLLQTHS